jgi:hypothetical protein
MENALALYHTLLGVLGQRWKWIACTGSVANIASDLIQASAWHGVPIPGDLLWTPHSRANGGILKAT